MSGTPRIASPGTPPLLWSDIEEAFRNINQNFNDLYATIQADGSTQVVNFASLNDDVSPAISGVYELGDFTKSWKKLNLTGYSEIPGNELNGLWLGLAHVVDNGTAVVLPPDSRVGDDLIIDSAKTFWKTFSIDSENFVEATTFADTLNINSGTAIQIVVDSSAESLTFNNTGVTGLIAGTGTSVSSGTGNITVTNTGVITLTNASALPAGLTAGSGIAVSGSTGNIALTNTGVIDVQNGFGITVSRDDATGIVTVTNNAPAQVAYRTISVDGSPALVADSTADTLVVEAGYGMNITTSEVVEDTLIIAVDPNIDISGSVFANDSTVIVDSIDQRVFAAGGFTGDLVGDTAGYHTGDVKGSIFGDDSTLLVNAVDGTIVGPIDSTGTLDGELIGSVFADDSTILVDGVAGKIVGNVDTSQIETTLITSRGGNNNTSGQSLILAAANGTGTGGFLIMGGGTGTAGNGGSVSIAAGPGAAGNGGSTVISSGTGSVNGGLMSIVGGTGDSGDGGLVQITGGTAGGSGNGTGGGVSIFGGPGVGGDGVINIGLSTTSVVNIAKAVITGDITGSVFADNSTMLVDGTNGTLAYYPTTAGDWDGDAPTTVGEAIDRLAALVKTLNSGTGA